MRRFSGWLPWTVLYAIAFLGYLLLWWEDAPRMADDSYGYLRTAEQIATLSFDQFEIRPPGLALILIPTDSVDQPSKAFFIVSLLLHLVSVFILHLGLVKAGVGKRWVLSAVVVMLLPLYAAKATSVLAENLGGVLLIISTYTAVKSIHGGKVLWAVLSGGMFAVAALTHPTYILSFAAVWGVLLVAVGLAGWLEEYWERLWKNSIALVAVAVLVLGGYSLFNYVKFDYFGITYFSGFALSAKTVTVLEDIPDEHEQVRRILIEARNNDLIHGSSHSAKSYIWRAYDDLQASTGLSGPDLSKKLSSIYVDLIIRNPLSYLREVESSLAGFWHPAASRTANLNSSMLQAVWMCALLTLHLAFFVLVPACAFALVLAKRDALVGFKHLLSRESLSRRISFRVLFFSGTVGIVLYTMTIVALFGEGIPRYRQPVDLFILVTVVIGLESCVRILRSEESST